MTLHSVSRHNTIGDCWYTKVNTGVTRLGVIRLLEKLSHLVFIFFFSRSIIQLRIGEAGSSGRSRSGGMFRLSSRIRRSRFKVIYFGISSREYSAAESFSFDPPFLCLWHSHRQLEFSLFSWPTISLISDFQRDSVSIASYLEGSSVAACQWLEGEFSKTLLAIHPSQNTPHQEDAPHETLSYMQNGSCPKKKKSTAQNTERKMLAQRASWKSTAQNATRNMLLLLTRDWALTRRSLSFEVLLQWEYHGFSVPQGSPCMYYGVLHLKRILDVYVFMYRIVCYTVTLSIINNKMMPRIFLFSWTRLLCGVHCNNAM